jgi:hypothetical protein
VKTKRSMDGFGEPTLAHKYEGVAYVKVWRYVQNTTNTHIQHTHTHTHTHTHVSYIRASKPNDGGEAREKRGVEVKHEHGTRVEARKEFLEKLWLN